MGFLPPDEETDELEDSEIKASDLEFFFLWDTKEEIFELYKLTKLFLTSTDNLDPSLIKDLCLEDKLPFKESLMDLVFIHSGYLSVIQKPSPKEEDKDS